MYPLATRQPLIYSSSASLTPSPPFHYVGAKSRRHRIPAAGKFHRHKITAMRAVVQRVASASVEVEGRIVSAIGPGLLVLVGIHSSDVDSDADFICRKVLNMRLFTNEQSGKPWDLNVMQKNMEVLLVSQFTLYGILKGNKPDFHVAMSPEKARPFYNTVVEKIREAYKPDLVKDGIFGAMMMVSSVNDGPVTLQIDSSQPPREVNPPQSATVSSRTLQTSGNGEVEALQKGLT